MRIDWDTPMDMLIHGDDIAYIDLNEDEICHWKYIKREKLPNGKYRYYYDQSELDQYKMIADKTAADYKKASGRAYDAKVAENEAKTAWKNARKGTAKTKSGLAYESAKKQRKSAEKQADSAREVAEKAKSVYEKKRVSSFPARTIAKGAVKVANFFSGANKKTKKKTKVKVEFGPVKYIKK